MTKNEVDEIIRKHGMWLSAQGDARANLIIADGLGGPEGYLRYLYIDGLKVSRNRSIIYIPTEAGLPILEAGRGIE